jgi:hypothetical protein
MKQKRRNARGRGLLLYAGAAWQKKLCIKWKTAALIALLAMPAAARIAAQEVSAFSPDGRLGVSAAGDGTVKLWDTESGRELHILSGHNGGVASLAFSPNGRYVVSVSGTGIVKLWNAGSGAELKAFSDPAGRIASASFSPDGRYVISVSADGALKLWNGLTGVELDEFDSDDRPLSIAIRNISIFMDTNILEDGSETNFSLGYRYTPLTDGSLRLRYTKTSYNDNWNNDESYDESLMANDELIFETFLLPYRRSFFSGSPLSFDLGAGAYYEYNKLDVEGYFHHVHPLVGLNMYRNDYSMHLLGPLAEAGLRLRTRPVYITLDLGIVPVFYLRRDQSQLVRPYMGTEFFEHSQDTSGSPYFYGELTGVFFGLLSLGVKYEYSRIDYDVISIDGSGKWAIAPEELVARSFKLEASLLLPLSAGLSLQLGYGRSFATIEVDSGTPLDDNGYYFTIGLEKN